MRQTQERLCLKNGDKIHLRQCVGAFYFFVYLKAHMLNAKENGVYIATL